MVRCRRSRIFILYNFIHYIKRYYSGKIFHEIMDTNYNKRSLLYIQKVMIIIINKKLTLVHGKTSSFF